MRTFERRIRSANGPSRNERVDRTIGDSCQPQSSAFLARRHLIIACDRLTHSSEHVGAYQQIHLCGAAETDTNPIVAMCDQLLNRFLPCWAWQFAYACLPHSKPWFCSTCAQYCLKGVETDPASKGHSKRWRDRDLRFDSPFTHPHQTMHSVLAYQPGSRPRPPAASCKPSLAGCLRQPARRTTAWHLPG